MLQAQAMNILKESNESRELHSAACNFTKKPGHIYHLYQRASGQNYFSMLSPEVRLRYMLMNACLNINHFRNGITLLTKHTKEAIG